MTMPTINATLPSEPLNFTARAMNGTLFFQWDQPVCLPSDTRYQIISAPGSASAIESGTVLWNGSDRSASVPVNALSIAYYWVRAYRWAPNTGNFGPYMPNTFGLPLSPFFPNNGAAVGLLNDPDYLASNITSSWTRFLTNSSTITRGTPGNVGGYARWNVRNDLANQNILRQCAVTTVAAGKQIQVELQWRVNSAIGGTGIPGMMVNIYRAANVNSNGFLLDTVQITTGVESLGAWRTWVARYDWVASSPAYNFPLLEIDKSSGASSGQLDVDHAQIYALR